MISIWDVSKVTDKFDVSNLYMTGIAGLTAGFEKRKVYRHDTVRRRAREVVEKEFEHRLVGLARHDVKLPEGSDKEREGGGWLREKK